MRHVYTTIDVPSLACVDGDNSQHLLLIGPGGGGGSCCVSCILTIMTDEATPSITSCTLLEHLVKLLQCEPSILSHSGIEIHSWLVSLVATMRSPSLLHQQLIDAATHHRCLATLDAFMVLALSMDAPFVLQALHDGLADASTSDDAKAAIVGLISDLLVAPSVASEDRDDAAHHDSSRDVAHSLFLNALVAIEGSGDTYGGTTALVEGPQLIVHLLHMTAQYLASPTLLLPTGCSSSDTAARRGFVALLCFTSLQLIQHGAVATIGDGDMTSVIYTLVRSCGQAAERFHMEPCDITANALALLRAALELVAVRRSAESVKAIDHIPTLQITGATARQYPPANPYVSFMSSPIEDSLSFTMRDESQPLMLTDAVEETDLEMLSGDVLSSMMPLMLSTSETIAGAVAAILEHLVSEVLSRESSALLASLAPNLFLHACEALRTRGSRSQASIPIFHLAALCFRILQEAQPSRQEAAHFNPQLGLFLLDIMETDATCFTDTVMPTELFAAAMVLCDVHDVAAKVMCLIKLSGMTLHSIVVLLDITLSLRGAGSLSSTSIQLLAHNTIVMVLDPILRPATAAGDPASGNGDHSAATAAVLGLARLSNWLQVRVCNIVVRLAAVSPILVDWCVYVYTHLRSVTRGGSTTSTIAKACMPTNSHVSLVLCNSVLFPILCVAADLVLSHALRCLHGEARFDASVSLHILIEDVADFSVQTLATNGGVGPFATEAHRLLDLVVRACAIPATHDAPRIEHNGMALLSVPVKQIFATLSPGTRPLSLYDLSITLLCSTSMVDVACGTLASLSRSILAPVDQQHISELADAIVRALSVVLMTAHEAHHHDRVPAAPDLMVWLYYLLHQQCMMTRESVMPRVVLSILDAHFEKQRITEDVASAQRCTTESIKLLLDMIRLNNQNDDAIARLLEFVQRLAVTTVVAESQCATDGATQHCAQLFGAIVLNILQLEGHNAAVVSLLCDCVVGAQVVKAAQEEHDVTTNSSLCDIQSVCHSSNLSALRAICRAAFTPSLSFHLPQQHRNYATPRNTIGDAVLMFLCGCQEIAPLEVSQFLALNFIGPFLMAALREAVVAAPQHRVNSIACLLLPCIVLPGSNATNNSKNCPYLRVFARWALDAFEVHFTDAEEVTVSRLARVLSACIELRCGNDITSRVVTLLAASPAPPAPPPQRSIDLVQLSHTAHRALSCDATSALVKRMSSLPALMELLGANAAETPSGTKPLAAIDLASLERVAGLCASFFPTLIQSDAHVTINARQSNHLAPVLWVGFAVEAFLRTAMVARPPLCFSPVCLYLCALVLKRFPEGVHLPAVLALLLQLQRLLNNLANNLAAAAPNALDCMTTQAVQIVVQAVTSGGPIWSSSTIGSTAIAQLVIVCDTLNISGSSTPLSSSHCNGQNPAHHLDVVTTTASQLFCHTACGAPLDFFVFTPI